MVVMKRFCDCCGIEIKDDIEDLAKLDINCDYNVDKSFSSPTIELCIDCWGSVKNIIGHKFQNVIIQEPTVKLGDVLSHKQLKCRNCENNKDCIVCNSCNGPYPIKEEK